jgi:hypothetical protein
MRLYKTSRERYFTQRLSSGDRDPFDVRAIDLHVGRKSSNAELAECVYRIVDRFESLRMALTESRKGLRAHVPNRRTWTLDVHTDSPLANAIRSKPNFIYENTNAINLISGNTAAIHYYIYPGEDSALLRILCSHFATDHLSNRLMHVFAEAVFSDRSLDDSSTNYSNWLDACDQYTKSSDALRDMHFWLNLSPEPFLQAQQFALRHSGSTRRQYAINIPAPVHARIRASANSQGAKIEEYYTAIVIAAIAQCSGSRDIIETTRSWPTKVDQSQTSAPMRTSRCPGRRSDPTAARVSDTYTQSHRGIVPPKYVRFLEGISTFLLWQVPRNAVMLTKPYRAQIFTGEI